MIFKKVNSITWWIPGGCLKYTGKPKTSFRWILGTYKSYIAFWKLLFSVAKITIKEQRKINAKKDLEKY